MPIPTAAGLGSPLITPPLSPPPPPSLHHLPPQTDTEILVSYKTFLYKLTPTSFCPSLFLLTLLGIRDTGVWAPPTPPEL